MKDLLYWTLMLMILVIGLSICLWRADNIIQALNAELATCSRYNYVVDDNDNEIRKRDTQLQKDFDGLSRAIADEHRTRCGQ